MINVRLMIVKSIAECSPWSIQQYFWPALSEHSAHWSIQQYFWSALSEHSAPWSIQQYFWPALSEHLAIHLTCIKPYSVLKILFLIFLSCRFGHILLFATSKISWLGHYLRYASNSFEQFIENLYAKYDPNIPKGSRVMRIFTNWVM